MNPNEASANKWKNITTNGLTSTPGKLVLIAIVVNTKGGSSNTAKIYDDASGDESPERLIATIDTTASVGRIEYGLPMYRGINIRMATGTAANLTLIYSETP